MRTLPAVTRGSHPEPDPGDELALIDIAPLLDGSDVDGVALQIDAACRSLGFFRITGDGIAPHLLTDLDRLARRFFALPDHEKETVAMAHAGAAWRSWFPVRGELTSGVPDRKEGLYVGLEHPANHPQVLAKTPLHGANLFPPGGLGTAVLAWLDALRPVADALMRAIATGLGLPPTWFEELLTADPTVLFRIFHYPPMPDNEVADEVVLGGLEVRTPAGAWIRVPAEPDVLVCNIA